VTAAEKGQSQQKQLSQILGIDGEADFALTFESLLKDIANLADTARGPSGEHLQENLYIRTDAFLSPQTYIVTPDNIRSFTSRSPCGEEFLNVMSF
jgi:hypothetical protein